MVQLPLLYKISHNKYPISPYMIFSGLFSFILRMWQQSAQHWGCNNLAQCQWCTVHHRNSWKSQLQKKMPLQSLQVNYMHWHNSFTNNVYSRSLRSATLNQEIISHTRHTRKYGTQHTLFTVHADNFTGTTVELQLQNFSNQVRKLEAVE